MKLTTHPDETVLAGGIRDSDGNSSGQETW